MTDLLKLALEKVKQLPEEEQDQAAAELMRFLEEIPSDEEKEAILAGAKAYRDGNYITLDQWQHDVGIGAH